MKNLVLKVPVFILTILILSPLLVFGIEQITEESTLKKIPMEFLFLVASVTRLIWLFSIVDYFQSKLESNKYIKLIHFLLAIDASLVLLNFFIIETLDFYIGVILYLLPILIHMTATVFVTLLVRKVFYERSVWFIVIEIFTTFVGVVTLTPEIKRNEKEID